ncbi:hypothetical protein EUTSA_v10023094mg, partial [Eutrema salsugineum]
EANAALIGDGNTDVDPRARFQTRVPPMSPLDDTVRLTGNRSGQQYENNVQDDDGTNLSLSPVELVAALNRMSGMVRWPPKIKAPAERCDTLKWSNFHSDHGNRTEDCVSLRMKLEIALIEEITRGRRKNLLLGHLQSTIVSFMLSLEVQRLVEYHIQLPRGALELLKVTREIIDFTSEEGGEVLALHHDALVISSTVANSFMKRTLIDNGSSTNILFIEAFKGLGLDEPALTRKSTPLVGFSGEVKQTVREVTLHVYVGGINKQTNCLILDCASAYNTSMGRPWIHDMGAML